MCGHIVWIFRSSRCVEVDIYQGISQVVIFNFRIIQSIKIVIKIRERQIMHASLLDTSSKILRSSAGTNVYQSKGDILLQIPNNIDRVWLTASQNLQTASIVKIETWLFYADAYSVLMWSTHEHSGKIWKCTSSFNHNSISSICKALAMRCISIFSISAWILSNPCASPLFAC